MKTMRNAQQSCVETQKLYRKGDILYAYNMSERQLDLNRPWKKRL